MVALGLCLVTLPLLWALAHNAAFTARLVAHLPGITVLGPKGPLLGDFSADRIDIALPRGGLLSLRSPAWQGLAVKLDGDAPWGLGVSVARLSVHKLALSWVPGPSGGSSGPPDQLSLPVSVRVQRLTVDQADSTLWGEAPLQSLDAALQLQTFSGRQAVHQVQLTRLQWRGWQFSGDARLGVAAGLPLSATLRARSLADTPAITAGEAQGAADLRATGPLKRLNLQGQLTWQPAQGPAQGVQLDADVAPFDVWPLPRLQATLQSLDLSVLGTGWPSTRLLGQVTVSPVAATGLRAQLDLRNAPAGAWTAQRLPLRLLKGSVVLPQALQVAELTQAWQTGEMDLDARLPTLGGRPDASLTLRGGWGGQRSLRAQWSELEPQALHDQAPPLQVQGQLTLTPAWPAKDALDPAHLRQMQVAVEADLTGHYGERYAMRGSPVPPSAGVVAVPVSLRLRAHYGDGRLSVPTLTLQASQAQAEVKDAVLQWGSAQPGPAWSVSGQAQVRDFDPRVWLPLPADLQGRSALTGQLSLDLDADWRGQFQLDMAPSWLAGVPLVGHAHWLSPKARTAMALSSDLDLGGNTFQLSAELPWQRRPDGRPAWGQGAHWQGEVHAPSLASLQALGPLLGLHELTGSVQASFTGQGLWPALNTQGHAQVQGLHWLTGGGTRMGLATADADWAVDGLSPDAPLKAQVALSGFEAVHVVLDKALLQASGSVRAHRLSLSADLHHEASASGKVTAFRLASDLQGQWSTQSASWQGHIDKLAVVMGDDSPPRALLATQGVDLHWRQAKGQPAAPQSLDIGPTALDVLGARLNLRHLHWQGSTEADDPVGTLDAALELAPLNLPQVLASWQPQAGWGGDLVLGGAIRVQHSRQQPWLVDAHVGRQSGDLTLSEPTVQGNSTQRMGIRDAKLALQARDGVWTLSERFDGRVLGLVTGQQTVRASAPDQLPTREDPLSGVLDLQIASLRPWGTWVPAGWRLTGQLAAHAELAGTLGVPQYRGHAKGENLGLGQALLGINLSEGQLAMDLAGDHIALTRLEAQSGAQGGRISAQGQLSLGPSPQATLSVQADHFALLQRVDRRVVISGDAQASFDQALVDLRAKVQVDEGLIDITRSDAPTVGDDVNVVNRPGDSEDEAPDTASQPGAKRRFDTDITLDLGHKLRIKGRGLDAFLTGQLHGSSPANKPTVKGTVHVANGTFAAYGQKLLIERGDVAFSGTADNPRLDILAMRPQSPTASSSDVKVGVNITGTAQDPRIRLYSEPAMSETEKLSWLVLGRGPSGLGGADIGLLQSAAVALLSGENSSPSDNIVAMLGLDELSVRQSEGAGAVRDTVVNVGKQVSKFWYVGYERNLNATAGNWQLIYRLAQRFTVRAQTGDDNAVDFIWSWRWD